MNYSDKDRKYVQAKNRVEKLKAFYTHLTVYIIVNTAISAFKIIRNIKRGESFEEAFFDINTSGVWLLWGIGLAIHAFAVFGLPLILGHNWEEEKIKQFMEEEQKNKFN